MGYVKIRQESLFMQMRLALSTSSISFCSSVKKDNFCRENTKMFKKHNEFTILITDSDAFCGWVQRRFVPWHASIEMTLRMTPNRFQGSLLKWSSK